MEFVFALISKVIKNAGMRSYKEVRNWTDCSITAMSGGSLENDR